MPHDGVVGPHYHHPVDDHDHAVKHGHGLASGPSRRAVLGGAAGALVAASTRTAQAQAVEKMTRAAQALGAAVDDRLRARLMLPMDSAARRDWHYIPRSRSGVAIRDMNAGQRSAAAALLESGLSQAGLQRIEGVRKLEGILREQQGSWRDPDNYAVTIFGVPGTFPWGWKFEGHHLSLNFTVLGAAEAVATPAFWGANPARADDGFRLLARMEDGGRALMRALPDAQKREATIADRAFGEIVAGPGREKDLGQPRGVALGAMAEAQRRQALDIVSEFVGALAADLAAAQTRRLREAGTDALRFAWAGSIEPGRPTYFRLHGPTTVVELDNSQNGANHIHSVWRDLTSDFGHDALAEHYRRGHKQ